MNMLIRFLQTYTFTSNELPIRTDSFAFKVKHVFIFLSNNLIEALGGTRVMLKQSKCIGSDD